MKDTLKQAHEPFAEAAAMVKATAAGFSDPVLMPAGHAESLPSESGCAKLILCRVLLLPMHAELPELRE
jgi:hypothetical protein